MKLDPRHLEMLAAIVDHGGVGEGAAALNKSQPSVSRSLHLLQERVGTPLFEKGRRPLVPTEFCIQLAAEGRKITEAGSVATDLVAKARTGQGGAVRVAGTPFFMDGVVSEMLARFQSEFMEIRIEQTYGYAAEVLAGLQNGTIDLGILPVRENAIPEDLHFSRILRGQNVVACRVGHNLSERSSVDLNDLANFSWIAPPVGSPLYHDLRSALEAIGVKHFRISFTGGTLSSVVNILSQSDSLTVLPYSVVFNMRRQNRLAALPIRIGDPDRHLGLVYRHETLEDRSTHRLAEFIESEFKTLKSLIQRQGQNTLWKN